MRCSRLTRWEKRTRGKGLISWCCRKDGQCQREHGRGGESWPLGKTCVQSQSGISSQPHRSQSLHPLLRLPVHQSCSSTLWGYHQIYLHVLELFVTAFNTSCYQNNCLCWQGWLHSPQGKEERALAKPRAHSQGRDELQVLLRAGPGQEPEPAGGTPARLGTEELALLFLAGVDLKKPRGNSPAD